MSDRQDESEMVSEIRREGDSLIAAVRGEIDQHNSPQLRSHLLRLVDEQKPKKLVLNVAAVPYMDSSGIAVLVEALKKIRENAGKIFLTNLQPRVRGLLEIARLDSIFVLTRDEAEALGK